jgi:hypothetical protein
MLLLGSPSYGADHKVEEALRNFVWFTLLGVVCSFGTQPGLAQPAVCGGDYVCITEESPAAVAPLNQSPAFAKMANLAGLERCPGSPVATVVCLGSS